MAGLKGHEHNVHTVVVTANGKTAASASWDGTVGLWDVVDGKTLHIFKNQNGLNPQSARLHSRWHGSDRRSGNGQSGIWQFGKSRRSATLGCQERQAVSGLAPLPQCLHGGCFAGRCNTGCRNLRPHPYVALKRLLQPGRP